MATLIIKPYIPKPPSRSIRKAPTKLNARQPSSLEKNWRIDSSDMLVGMLQAPGGATDDNDWPEKAARDSETTVQDVQGSGDNLAEAQGGSIAEREGSSDDTDDEFPSLTRLLSSKNKHISAEEGQGVNSHTTEKSSDQALDDDLSGSRESRTGSSHDEPIILDSDDRSENGNGNLDIGYAPRILDSGQPATDAFNLESPLTLYNRIANECGNGDDGDNSIEDDNKSPRGAKRPRSASPPYNSIPGHSSTSPLSLNEDGEGSREIWSKRRKVSVPLGGGIASNSPNEQSQRPPSPITEDDEDDGTLSISADGIRASAAEATPASGSTPRTESQPCPQTFDANQDWEVREIIGKEDVGGVLHYLVDWHPTLLPEHSLGYAEELVDKFESRLRAQRGVKNARGERGLKRGGRMVVKADASDGPQQRRGREAGRGSK